MMTSWNGNIFCVTGPLGGETTGNLHVFTWTKVEQTVELSVLLSTMILMWCLCIINILQTISRAQTVPIYWSVGACPTNYHQISNLIEIHSSIPSSLSVWSQRNFAHTKTAVLSWYVQNFVVIRSTYFILYTPPHWEFDENILSGMCARCDFWCVSHLELDPPISNSSRVFTCTPCMRKCLLLGWQI